MDKIVSGIDGVQSALLAMTTAKVQLARLDPHFKPSERQALKLKKLLQDLQAAVDMLTAAPDNSESD